MRPLPGRSGSTPCVWCVVSGVSTPVKRTVERAQSSRTLMVSPSIGVRPRIRYAVNRIDEEYFDGEDL